MNPNNSCHQTLCILFGATISQNVTQIIVYVAWMLMHLSLFSQFFKNIKKCANNMLTKSNIMFESVELQAQPDLDRLNKLEPNRHPDDIRKQEPDRRDGSMSQIRAGTKRIEVA